MASTPYEYDIFQQHTFEDNIISQSHDIASQFINIELTIDFVFIPVHHDFLADISTSTNHTSLRETFRFELDILENQYLLDQALIGTNREVLPLRSVIHVSIVDSDGVSMGRALAESALEFESSNYGMVPAKESLVKEMVRMVRVEDGDQEDCMICLEELEVGFYASRMPCSHTFHGDCIENWLKQSHYCPFCRFEMPTN
ncbi:E3 ubiquitin-protein ligase MPSR1 [Gossypium hirsutum]|uniref:RING-type E3 ubiquitin transferase n=1 Tax=Gossypium hirsutum TaxID=3635 RepID=A0A1U8JLW7_GOSHI|nr:E3 ubiquitin-protein ligase MPSR1-like [Gossypium hirsutum]